MLEEFNKYVNKFDLNNEKILQKYNHSIRVMNLAIKYAKILGFNEEDTYLATLIGLIHDYGRFDQIKRYNSYSDTSMQNHASIGVKVLFDDKEIENYNVDPKYYDLIKFAIINHNKQKLEDNTNPDFIKHAKLIRDIDKIDIIYSLGVCKEIANFAVDDSAISPKIIESIKNHELVKKKDMITHNDGIAIKYGFIYDIYNKECLNEFFTNLEEFTEVVNRNNILDDLLKENKIYMEEKC